MKDLATAKNVLINFILAMNQWEVACKKEYRRQPDGDAIMESKLDGVFNKYCTIRERKYGRQAAIAYSHPPEYAPSEEILEGELINNRAIFVTQQHTGFKQKYRYTLHWKKDGWRVDKKECFRSNNKWEKYIL